MRYFIVVAALAVMAFTLANLESARVCAEQSGTATGDTMMDNATTESTMMENSMMDNAMAENTMMENSTMEQGNQE